VRRHKRAVADQFFHSNAAHSTLIRSLAAFGPRAAGRPSSGSALDVGTISRMGRDHHQRVNHRFSAQQPLQNQIFFGIRWFIKQPEVPSVIP